MNQTGPYANGLYPIVRRIRRPLVVVESVPDGPKAGKAEPVQPVATASEGAETPPVASNQPATEQKESRDEATDY